VKRTYRALEHAGSGVEKLLGELEHEVMEYIWARGRVPVRAVLEHLNASRPDDRRLAYTTVMTIMARLAEKGVLARHLVGKAHEYQAAETREEFLARSSQEMARRMVEDFGDAAIASFLAVLQDVAPDKVARLRRRGERGDGG
jgi:predicted transcriptional regulator